MKSLETSEIFWIYDKNREKTSDGTHENILL